MFVVQHAPASEVHVVGEQGVPSPRKVLELPQAPGVTVVHWNVVLLQQAPSVAPPQMLPEQFVPAPCQSPPTPLQAESVLSVQFVPSQQAPT